MALRTERLTLRRWEPRDAGPMAAINRDPEVTRWLNPVDETIVRGFHGAMARHWREHGYGPWVVERREDGALLGFVGVARVGAHVPAVAGRPELGWRLARAAWGHGYATEAGAAARDHAFAQLGCRTLVSLIHPRNARSQAVAARLGFALEREVPNPAGGVVEVWTLDAPATGRPGSRSG